MFLYLKIAGGFKQKSSRPIEAHVRIVSYNIFFLRRKKSKICMYITVLYFAILCFFMAATFQE